MRFVIRADAFKRTGSGHITRSIAVAEQLLSRNLTVVFVGNTSELPWVHELIKLTNFSEIYQNEGDFISSNASDILIVDSYDIPVSSPFLNRNRWMKIIVLVDNFTPDYQGDLNIYLTLRSFDSSRRTSGLSIGGPEYFPIRRSLKLNRKPSALTQFPQILLTTGGNEIFRLMDQFINILANIDCKFSAEILSNRSFQNLDSRFHVSRIDTNLHKKLMSADVVLSSAGVTSIEIAANQIYMGLYCAVENQRENYNQLVENGYAQGLGEFDRNDGLVNEKKVMAILSGLNEGKFFQANIDNRIGFDGSENIVNSILNLI